MRAYRTIGPTLVFEIDAGLVGVGEDWVEGFGHGFCPFVLDRIADAVCFVKYIIRTLFLSQIKSGNRDGDNFLPAAGALAIVAEAKGAEDTDETYSRVRDCRQT
jgi:hypothetical protein